MKYIPIGPVRIASFSKEEAQRIPNLILGRCTRINVPQTLLANEKISKYVNENTMGALNNYAKHEKLNIYISPLENDLFDDMKVSVFSDYHLSQTKRINSQFPIKIPEGNGSFRDFIRTLYKNVADIVNNSKNSKK